MRCAVVRGTIRIIYHGPQPWIGSAAEERSARLSKSVPSPSFKFFHTWKKHSCTFHALMNPLRRTVTLHTRSVQTEAAPNQQYLDNVSAGFRLQEQVLLTLS